MGRRKGFARKRLKRRPRRRREKETSRRSRSEETRNDASPKRKATSCRQGRRSQSIRRRRCSRRKKRNDQNQRAIRGRERFPFPSESNPSMSITWTQTNLAPKARNFGIPLLDLKPKSMILRKDKRGRTTTSKSSRKDRSNN